MPRAYEHTRTHHARVQLAAYSEAVAGRAQPASPTISPSQALVLLKDSTRLCNAACMHVRYYADLAGESAAPAARGLDDAERWLVSGGRKLRVGYLSEDFGHTSVGQLVQARVGSE